MQKIFFACLFLSFCACHRDKTQCPCRSLEDCIDDKCVLQANSFYINNQGVKGTNLYHGVVNGNVCLDTLAFDLNPNDPNPLHQFKFYAYVESKGLISTRLYLKEKISENEYTIGGIETICRKDSGKERYPAFVHFKISPDSIWMTLKFREFFDTSNQFVDSCQVTLHK